MLRKLETEEVARLMVGISGLAFLSFLPFGDSVLLLSGYTERWKKLVFSCDLDSRL